MYNVTAWAMNFKRPRVAIVKGRMRIFIMGLMVIAASARAAPVVKIPVSSSLKTRPVARLWAVKRAMVSMAKILKRRFIKSVWLYESVFVNF